MNLLTPEEKLIEGHWISVAGGIAADEAAHRIEVLVSSHLKLVAVCDGGWSKLYRDPQDGRLWEHTFPQSEMHGGGPPRLEVMPLDKARLRYQFKI